MPTNVRSTAGASSQNLGRVAITGACGFLGTLLLEKLRHHPGVKSILAIDPSQPTIHDKKMEWMKTDLTEKAIDQKLTAKFRKLKIQTLIHTSPLAKPIRNLERAHEVESVGTMHLLIAAEAAKLKKLILASTTDVYGALPDNPNFLTEEHPARGGTLGPFLKDKIEVEKQFLHFHKKNPERTVTLLRLATVLGPTVSHFKTHFLQNPMIPMVLGFDPLVQFIHETDCLRAIILALEEKHSGIFNITTEGVIPLSRTVRLLRKQIVPVPSFLLYPAADFLWYLNIGSVPPAHVGFLQYMCVADGTKAFKQMKFKPVYNSYETVMSFTAKNLDRQTAQQKLEDCIDA